MSSHAVSYALLHRRGSRAFFLARSTQHLKTLELARETTRALVALGAVIAWGCVGLLLWG
jgi:hypothetical protein